MILLDTDIVIDVLRGHTPTIVWLNTIQEEVALPGFAAMELVQGCHNKTEQKRVEQILAKTRLLWLSGEGCELALSLFLKLRLQHGIGLLDILIAQTAMEFNLTLHTFNLKHYKIVSGLKIMPPYPKI